MLLIVSRLRGTSRQHGPEEWHVLIIQCESPAQLRQSQEGGWSEYIHTHSSEWLHTALWVPALRSSSWSTSVLFLFLSGSHEGRTCWYFSSGCITLPCLPGCYWTHWREEEQETPPSKRDSVWQSEYSGAAQQRWQPDRGLAGGAAKTVGYKTQNGFHIFLFVLMLLIGGAADKKGTKQVLELTKKPHRMVSISNYRPALESSRIPYFCIKPRWTSQTLLKN